MWDFYSKGTKGRLSFPTVVLGGFWILWPHTAFPGCLLCSSFSFGTWQALGGKELTVEPMSSERKPPVKAPERIWSSPPPNKHGQEMTRDDKNAPIEPISYSSHVTRNVDFCSVAEVPKPQSTVFVGGLAPEMDEGATWSNMEQHGANMEQTWSNHATLIM